MSVFKAILLTAAIGIFAVSFLSLIALIGLGGGDQAGSRIPPTEEPTAGPTGSPSPGASPSPTRTGFTIGATFEHQA